MTIGDTRKEAEPFTTQPVVQEINKFCGFGCGDMSSRMVLQQPSLDCHQITPHRHFVREDGHPHGGRLQHAPALVDAGNIVAQY